MQVPKPNREILVHAARIFALGLLSLCVGCGQDGSGDTKLSTTGANPRETAGMATREFTVEGMMCQGCADNVTNAIAKIPGVRSAKVSLAEKRAVVVADPSQVPSDKIEAVVAAAGYKAKVCPVKGPQT
jgi:copper chaperone CopZ